MKSLFNMIMGRGELQKDEESYKKQWNIVSPAVDAAGEGAKGFTCLQILIAIMHWTGAQANRSRRRSHSSACYPPSIVSHGNDPTSSQKRISSLCFGVAKLTHFQPGFKLAVLCVHCQSAPKHTSLLLPCCKGKQLGRAVAQLFFRTSHKALSPWDCWGLCWMEKFHLCMETSWKLLWVTCC